MVLKSFPKTNWVSLFAVGSLGQRVINSTVVVGLFYGLITTLCIGSSYLFLFRDKAMEEESEKRVSAITGFVTGQLMLFISIYYSPLHLALGRPHAFTILVLPYLFFHLLRWNDKENFVSESFRPTIRSAIGRTAVYLPALRRSLMRKKKMAMRKKKMAMRRNSTRRNPMRRNPMRNLSILCVFLNQLIFQLFNNFSLPSSMLARLVNIFLFRCNNRILFVTCSLIGWLIGHILFMKWAGLVLVWIQQKPFIRLNKYVQSNEYLPSQIKYAIAEFCYLVSCSTARTFSIFLFINFVYYLGRTPLLSRKLESPVKTDEKALISNEKKKKKKKNPDPDPDKIGKAEKIRVNRVNRDEKIKDGFDFWVDFVEKLPVILLFDYKGWNRPLRYLKNRSRLVVGAADLHGAVKNETSQYFFYECRSDGKHRISFTYLPSVLSLCKYVKTILVSFTNLKTNWEKMELYNYWVYTRNIKRNKVKHELLNRIKALDMGLPSPDILEKRTRLCTDKTENKYLPQKYDPFLKGPGRATTKTLSEYDIRYKLKKAGVYKKIYKEENRLNTIFGSCRIVLITNNKFTAEAKERQLEYKMGKRDPVYQTGLFDKKPFSFISQFTRKLSHFLTFISQFARESGLSFNLKSLSLFSEKEHPQKRKNPFVLMKDIRRRVPRWPNDLITEWEGLELASQKEEEEEEEEEAIIDPDIYSRRVEEILLWREKTPWREKTADVLTTAEPEEVNLINFLDEPDFRRNLIIGSPRTERRKVLISKLINSKAHSPIFGGRIPNSFHFYFVQPMKFLFRNWRGKRTESKIINYTEKETKRREEKAKRKKEKRKAEEQLRMEVEQTWDNLLYGHAIRSSLLLMQSNLRKSILLPLFIIAKNMSRFLFLQVPEWSEDFKEWKREIHVPCTHYGLPIKDEEVWPHVTAEGLDIKIISPFCLKPWRRSKLQASRRDQIKNKEQSEKPEDDFCFLTTVGLEAEHPFGSPRKSFFSLFTSFFNPIFKKLGKKMSKMKTDALKVLRVLKFKKVVLEFSNENPIPLVSLKEVYESSEPKKDSMINNQIIDESFTQIRSRDRTNSSQTEQKMKREQKMKNLTHKTSTTRNQIERVTKKKKTVTNSRTNYNVESQPKKNIWKRLKKLKIQIKRIFKNKIVGLILISKLYSFYFQKFVIKKIYIDIFLRIINIARINTQLFLEFGFELQKKMIEKYISNNETNEEKMNKTTQKRIPSISISTIKKSRSNYTIRTNKKNSHIFYDLSSLSQGYVFYKLSQAQVFNLYKLKSVLQYHGTSFFLKTAIKDSFAIQGIFHSELRHKKLRSYDQWKNWLRGHSQYDLSPIRWSRLIPQKWRNRVNEHCTAEKKDFKKWSSYEKDLLFHYTNQNSCEVYSLPNQKNNFQKYCRYGLLSYKSMNYETKKDSYIYGSPLQVNKKKISDNYTLSKFTHVTEGMNITHFLSHFLRIAGKVDYQKQNRKYLDWKIQSFKLIKIGRRTQHVRKVSVEHTQGVGKTNSVDTKHVDGSAKGVGVDTKHVDGSTKGVGKANRVDTKQVDKDNNKANRVDTKQVDKDNNNDNKVDTKQVDKDNNNDNKVDSENHNRGDSENHKHISNENKGLFYINIEIPQEIEINPPKESWIKKLDKKKRIDPVTNRTPEFWFFPEFALLYKAYKEKPWIRPSKLLLLKTTIKKKNQNFNLRQNQNIKEKQKKKNQNIKEKQKKKNQNIKEKQKKKNQNIKEKQKKKNQKKGKQKGNFSSNEKRSFELKNRNQAAGQVDPHQAAGRVDPHQAAGKGDLYKLLADPDIKKIYFIRKEKVYVKIIGGKVYSLYSNIGPLVRRHLVFQLIWHNNLLKQRTLNILGPFTSSLQRDKSPKKIAKLAITAMKSNRLSVKQNLIPLQTEGNELLQLEVMVLKPIRVSVKNDGKFGKNDGKLIMYQTIGIPLAHKSKQQIYQGYRDQRYFNFDKSTPSHQRITGNRKQNHYDLLVPENILSSSRRRELRILISFNLKNRTGVDRHPLFYNDSEIINWGLVLNESKHRDKNKLIKLKFFLWPNYRLEDLACMNRYWFDTNNGSRFSMLRIYMYPRLKIR
nr:hypothetical chloroplast RF19 [Heptacodium miconioides]